MTLAFLLSMRHFDCAKMETSEISVQRVGNESHLSRLSSGLNQMRQHGTFCDVNIIVGDKRFPAHKLVLSSTSDYFQGMFSSGFQESTMSEVTVPGTEEGFAQILDFAYTGFFTLSLKTVTDILKMACYMVFAEVVELCAEYLKGVKDQLTFGDCFEVWSIANNHHSLTDVTQWYRSHLLQNFTKCVESQAFLENTSASVLMEFLSDEEIETDDMTEEHILQAALSWLKYDWEQRKVHAVDLLKKIRLGLVPLDRLREILGDEFYAIPACKDMVEEIVKLSVTKETASPPLAESHPELFATRNTITADVCADLYDMSNVFLSLKYTTNSACYRLTKVPDIPNRFSFMDDLDYQSSGMATYITEKGHLYAAGGSASVYYEDSEHKTETHLKWLTQNNFFRYDQENNVWILLPPMPILLYDPIMEKVDEYIYLIGAEDDNFESITSMLRYSIPDKTWTVEVEDLHFCATNAHVFQGHIIVKGDIKVQGPNLSNHPSNHGGFNVSQVGLYKPSQRSWSFVAIDNSDTVDIESYFIVRKDICYMVTKDKDKTQCNRVICDFGSDKPSMVTSEVVDYEDLEAYECHSLRFTFDKRKVGLKKKDCDCETHQQNRHESCTSSSDDSDSDTSSEEDSE